MAQGRCSAMLSTVALLLVSAAVVVQGTDHVVGGVNGWKAPGLGNSLGATYLEDWAKTQTFVVGDNLIFTYASAAHNVVKVSAADYASCAKTSIETYATGNDSIPLAAGTTNFICSIGNHCASGQKVSITATAAAPGTPGTPAAPTPPATTPPATSAPGNSAPGNALTLLLPALAAVTGAVVTSIW